MTCKQTPILQKFRKGGRATHYAMVQIINIPFDEVVDENDSKWQQYCDYLLK